MCSAVSTSTLVFAISRAAVASRIHPLSPMCHPGSNPCVTSQFHWKQLPNNTLSVRADKLANRRLTGLSGKFDFELFSPHIEDMDCSNNCSIVLKLTGLGARGFSYLLTGDTENPRWERINKLFGSALKSHVLAAPHHGSRNATHPASLVNIDPQTGVIIARVHSQYGHPHPQAVQC